MQTSNRKRRRFLSHCLSTSKVALAIAALALAVGATRERSSSNTVPHAAEPGPAVNVAVEPDEAVWEAEELIRLPKDPEKRRVAIEQARAYAKARPKRVPDVTYAPAGQLRLEPARPSEVTSIQSQATKRVSAREADAMSIGLPGDLELPRDVLQTLAEQDDDPIDRTVEQQVEAAFINTYQAFAGISQTAFTPPDCDIAVGPDHIVLVVNSTYAVYDRCGTQLVSMDLLSLGLLPDGAVAFNPRVLYDEDGGRWLVVLAAVDFATSNGWVVLIVSTSDTPPGLGSRFVYTFDWDARFGGNWGSFPDIGYDPNAIYITVNEFSFTSGFQGSRILVADKASFYAPEVTTFQFFTYPLNPTDGSAAFSIRAAEMKSWPGEYYLVNSKSTGGSFLTFWEITGTPAAPVLNGFNMSVGFYNDATPMAQGDGTFVSVGDARLLNAKYYVSRLWTAHTTEIIWGGVNLRSAAEIYVVNTVTRTVLDEVQFGGPDFWMCFPAVDMDALDRGVMTYMRGGATSFPSAYYIDYEEGVGLGSSTIFATGQGWKSDAFNAGTAGDPYVMGNYNGVELDGDGDNRSLWMVGQYALATGDWATQVGAVNFDGPPFLLVSGPSEANASGFEGGPFWPTEWIYTLTNTGSATAHWRPITVPFHLQPDPGGTIDPGETVFAKWALDPVIYTYPPGSFSTTFRMDECVTGSAFSYPTTYTIEENGSCPGAVLDVRTPQTAAINMSGFSSNIQERGFYCTAIQDFQLCAIAMEIDADLPQTLTARIYAANGTTRGALLAEGTVTAVEPGSVFHYIPINYTLQACQEYDISVEFETVNGFVYWTESSISLPFDVGSVVRVHDGHRDGVAGNAWIAHFSLIGEAAPPDLQDILDPGVAVTSSTTGSVLERGVYITAERSTHINSLGWRADISPGSLLSAAIYEAVGTTRGSLIATGSILTSDPGAAWHDIPINCVLKEGKNYDFTISAGASATWGWWTDTAHVPYTKGGIRVVDAHLFGNPTATPLVELRVNRGTYIAGSPTDLRKVGDVFPPPNATSFSPAEYGVFIESLIDQELYSLGWSADVPAGVSLTATVYSASGTTRGSIISQGTIFSSGSGTRFHDIPISASLVAGQDYDIAVFFPSVNEWRWWNDTFGLPYDVRGQIRIVEGEISGDETNAALMHFRVNSCNVTGTAVDNGPVSPPSFTLGAPYPNPVRTNATLPYSLDQAGQMTMTVYNVKGQRVATLLNERRPIGAGVAQFDASRLATGVYFVKMHTNTRSVTRKITIVR